MFIQVTLVDIVLGKLLFRLCSWQWNEIEQNVSNFNSASVNHALWYYYIVGILSDTLFIML